MSTVAEVVERLEKAFDEAQSKYGYYGTPAMGQFLQDTLAELEKMRDKTKDEELIKKIEALAEKVKKFMTYYYPPEYGDGKKDYPDLHYMKQTKNESVLIEAKEGGNGLVWKARLIEAGISKNNRYYAPEVLEQSVSKFDNVKCFTDHVINTNGLPRSVKDLVGWFENPVWNHETKSIESTFVALSESPIVGILKEAFDKNKPDLLGLSICAIATAKPKLVEGKKVYAIESIDEVLSVDVVTEPAAGGKLLKLYESAMIPVLEEEIEMDEEVKEVEVKEEIPPKVNIPDVEVPSIAPVVEPEAVKAEAKPKTEEVDAIKAQLERLNFELMLERKLRDQPKAIAELVRVRFADRVATEADVDSEIKKLVEFGAKIMEEKREPVVKVSFDEADKKIAALEGLLSGKAVDGVKPFRSLHESYCKFNNLDPWSVSRDKLATMILNDIASTKFTGEITEAVSWGDAFGTTMHRILMKDYEMPYLNEWQELVSDVVSLQDMRAHNVVRIGYYSTLPSVSGTYTEPASPDDEAVTLTPAKYGRLESYTWEDALNDDINALRKIPERLSVSAKWTIYKAVFDVLDTNATCDYDSTALIASAHANKSSSTLTTAAVAAAFSAMLSQSAPSASGFALGTTPKYLVVPPALRATAMQIRDGSFYVDGSTYVPNPVKEQFEVLVVPYWTTHTTYWYMAADKNVAPMLVIGFLNGNQAPEIVTEVPNTGSNFTADKVYFKVRLVFAVDVLDHRGFYGYVG